MGSPKLPPEFRNIGGAREVRKTLGLSTSASLPLQFPPTTSRSSRKNRPFQHRTKATPKTFNKESPKAPCFWIPKCPQTLTTKTKIDSDFGQIVGQRLCIFWEVLGAGLGPRPAQEVPRWAQEGHQGFQKTKKQISRKWFPHGTTSTSVAPNGTPQAKLLRSWLFGLFSKQS